MPEASSSSTKRRACDECRSRKLACSKEADGCERCIREKIKCHYSEQKPMGRPRKRQFIEATWDEPVIQDHMPDLGTLPFFANDLNSYNDGNFAEPYFTAGPTLEQVATELPEHTKTDDGRGVWQYGNSEITTGPPIQFGQVDFGNIDFSASPGDMDIPPAKPTPQLSTGSNPSAPESDTSSSAPAPCSCLASMYLALASLQTFPSDIKFALYTVRSAAETAQRSIWCPQCGAVVLTDNAPPIESFQNTMLLGTILPVIANGYGRVLQMIDDETNAAIAAGQTKSFQFHDYGGMNCGLKDSFSCTDKQNMLDNMEMEPQQWRTSVRALLRIDLYGYEQNGIKHKGLKDIIGEMEERQRTRHHILDAHIARGTAEKAFPKFWPGGHIVGGNLQQKCLGEMNETPTCLNIIKMARLAIDNLVIA